RVMVRILRGTVSTRKQILVLTGILSALSVSITLAPNGVLGFFHSISEQRDAFSIAVLLAFLGALFILLHRLGITLGYEDEVQGVQLGSKT
ncbi:MAG: hypothetical protein MN733_11930, partial [Nitrososphaera sp.]|nr:hypothetical protein [Nitrososphaera sp.]